MYMYMQTRNAQLFTYKIFIIDNPFKRDLLDIILLYFHIARYTIMGLNTQTCTYTQLCQTINRG